MYLVVIFVGVAIAAGVLLFPVHGLLRRAGVVDKPNARSSHAVPTVRGGGVAIVTVVALAVGWLTAAGGMLLGNGYAGAIGSYSLSVSRLQGWGMPVLLVAFLLLAIVSFIDDLRGLKPGLRFGVQLGCAVAAVWSLSATNNVSPVTINSATICSSLVAVLWTAGYTNAFNFMDGINGIAGMQALVTGAATSLIGLRLGLADQHPVVILGFVVAGAALGFLPHNFPRARVFMGDVSSAPLGFLLALLAFWIAELTSWWLLFWIALLQANFVLDCGITLIRRALRGEKLHEAHREHFYQRLVRAGYSHTFVTLTEAALQIVVGFVLWWATPRSVGVRVGVGVGVILLWCSFFAFAEAKFRAFSKAQARVPEHSPTG